MLLGVTGKTMETSELNGTTLFSLNTTYMEVITTTNTTERLETMSSTKIDTTHESTKATAAALEARVPPFNIAQLLHGHNQVVTGADARINHPLNIVQQNLTHGQGGNGNVILNFIKNGDMETGFMTAGVAVCLAMILLGVLCILRKKRRGYFRIPTSSDIKKYDYFYKPSNGNNTLDDEYENTFVGVSVPLLQEVTKV